VTQPREGPLHRPPARQHTPEAGPLGWQAAPFEGAWVASRPERDPFAARLGRVLDDLNGPVLVFLDPTLAGAGVTLIDPDVLDLRELLGGTIEQQRHGGSIL
jgi:hypothetical protein